MWADKAPDGNHSPLIGWALDGLPIYGPYDNNGKVPSDLDECGAHYQSKMGWHYHASFDGELSNAFLKCYKGYRAAQDWDGEEVVGNGDLAHCPEVTYIEPHSIEDYSKEYFKAIGEFEENKCNDKRG